jgi:mono/diheme cytochrome c family protein
LSARASLDTLKLRPTTWFDRKRHMHNSDAVTERAGRATRLTKYLAVLGAAFVVLTAVVGGAAVLLLRQGISARPSPSGLEASVALWLRGLAIPGRYENMKNPVTANPEVIRTAMEHWADHCASCHANDGSGRTEMGQNMYPRPPDMRGKRTQSMSDGELYYIINQGVRLSGMPAWGTPGDNDRGSWELVAFIRRLPSLTPAEIDAMKAMNPVSASQVKAKQDEDAFLDEEPASVPHKH